MLAFVMFLAYISWVEQAVTQANLQTTRKVARRVKAVEECKMWQENLNRVYEGSQELGTHFNAKILCKVLEISEKMKDCH